VTAMPGNPSNAADDRGAEREEDLEFLIVDDFLGTIVDARALKTASSSPGRSPRGAPQGSWRRSAGALAPTRRACGSCSTCSPRMG